ncbi:MAG: glycerol-3-phosphate dehydrogenase subunit GlpB [Deltaproteobacteria bacterium]|nr:glycerol-3-phosphate dehydrogenase subunit GlpB [Deltaproteobacteria bacterium]
MKDQTRLFKTELAVIGTGLAGVAASIFAMKRGITTAQTGNTGALAYTTGYLDLLGCDQQDSTLACSDPWEGLKRLRMSEPLHPLARISKKDIRASFDEFTSFISELGICYGTPGDQNLNGLTPAGTVKKTLCVPATMQHGVAAFSEKKRCVIIDFNGLRGFSGRQIVSNLQPEWPGLRSERIDFPDLEQVEIYPEVLARSLEAPHHRVALAAVVKKIVGNAEVVGMPAIFGIHGPDRVMEELQGLIGLPLFEIPTMPPSVPGIRLREMVEQFFPQKGINFIPQQKILSVEFKDDGACLKLKDNYGEIEFFSRAVILGTGRFISGGLEARMDSIIEPLLNIPVCQPESREDWYQQSYMDRSGHAIHRTGIEVDTLFRPVDQKGSPIHENLFAAGIILAHQDWIRGRCGAGVAIATAYKAVESAAKILHGSTF